MPAVATKPFDLKPVDAHAATLAAPALVAQTAAQAPSMAAPSLEAVAACASRSKWSPLSALATDDGSVSQALSASGSQRIPDIYQRKQQAVTAMETTEDENRQGLTLLTGGSEIVSV